MPSSSTTIAPTTPLYGNRRLSPAAEDRATLFAYFSGHELVRLKNRRAFLDVALLYTMRNADQEHRVHPRFPLILDIKMRELGLLFSQQQSPQTVLGRLQNLSRGGLCAFTDKSLDGASMVVCDIVVPELPVPIPVLANVRWSEQINNGSYHHLYGLQFIC